MTIHQPRPYQAKAETDVYAAWQAGAQNTLLVLPTGAGKTFTFSRIASQFKGPVRAVAHRAELVSQMSVALGREGVRHRVVGPDALRRQCVSAQLDATGRSYFDANANVAVCSVDSLTRAEPDPSVRLWIMDEAHHVLADNKWGRACALFPNARGLGVTATPTRADGRGLGRHADGLFDAMVVGPGMRDLIDAGYLCDYRLFAPPSDLDLRGVSVTDGGDFSPPKLSAARRRSHITGDVVQHYLRVARGKLGVTFDTDIESATDTAAAFRAAGVRAEVVTSKTPDALRAQVMRRFKAREILQLVNVDLFGEGYDLPAIEVVSFARPTQSYGLYVQQFGRALRILDGKGRAIILDHVGNIARHGLPDARREWTLDRREKRARSAVNDVIPTRVCLNESCVSVYERALASCPYCGTAAPPANGRSSPEQVDGDLAELDETALRALRGEISRVDGAPVYPVGAGREVQGAIFKRHLARATAQASLRNAMALWGGWQQSLGRDEREAQRRFFRRYRIDVGTAQTLGAAEAQQLRALVEAELAQIGVTNAP